MNLAAGTSYLFGVFSSELKHVFNYTEQEVRATCRCRSCTSHGRLQTTILGVMGQVGVFTGFLSGVYYDRFGPRITRHVVPFDTILCAHVAFVAASPWA
jgi:hypothetical protein